jgi:hypothetical protein
MEELLRSLSADGKAKSEELERLQEEFKQAKLFLHQYFHVFELKLERLLHDLQERAALKVQKN